MPHKVNPIRFENAEANLEVSNALLDVLSSTLVQSRMQRDLTDSSMQRNIGTAFGHSLLAIDNAGRGLPGVEAVPAAMASGTASTPASPRPALSIASREWPNAVPMLRCMLESVRSRCIRDCTRVEESTSSRALETSRLASAFSKRMGLTLCGIVDEPTVPWPRT